MLTALLGLLATFALVVPAPAATVHELIGEWADDLPETVQTGDALAATWRINVNDDAAAPGNEPVDDVTFEVTLANARFEGLPAACLTEGVDPESSITPDGATLLCNLGTVDQGTAVVVTTGVVVDGTSGEAVSATGSIAGASIALPEVTIDNEFAMDIRWQTNNGHTTRNGNNVDARFQWSLFHGAGADPGPDSVSYTITPRTSTGSTVTAAGCQAFTTRGASGHPYSGGDHPADRVAPFVDTCTLTANGNGTFTLTLSGIDYSKSHVPTHDSTGAPLPLGTDVVAAGQITLRVLNAPNAGNLEISVSAPQYVSPTGDTHADDSTNNSSATTWTSGVWSAGWRPNYTGQSLPSWSDTYRVAPGTRVQQNVSLLYGRDPSSITVSSFQQCLVLDSRYVEFVDARYGDGAGWNSARREDGVTFYYYYTGSSTLLNPGSSSYDPNQFLCNGTSGWTTAKPADLSQVRAVRVTVPRQTVIDSDWATLRVLTDIRKLRTPCPVRGVTPRLRPRRSAGGTSRVQRPAPAVGARRRAQATSASMVRPGRGPPGRGSGVVAGGRPCRDDARHERRQLDVVGLTAHDAQRGRGEVPRLPGSAAHSGMFPCFLAGSEARLVRSARSARTIWTRVWDGSMTAST